MTRIDLALTGVPRGGTTLCCQLLQQCADTVALFEPMDVTLLPTGSRELAIADVLRFFSTTREQILREGTAPSKHVDGEVPDNPFSGRITDSGRRALLATPGIIELTPRPGPGFTLVIKHNAAFTALLPELSSQLRTLAIVRNPLSVLASWNSVELPVSDGRLPAGERLDPVLAADLARETGRLSRQLLILEWFFSRFDHCLPVADVIRYEDVIATQGAALRKLAGVSGRPKLELRERNSNPLYRREDVTRLAEALVAGSGSWARWYDADCITQLAQRMLCKGSEAPPCP